MEVIGASAAAYRQRTRVLTRRLARTFHEGAWMIAQGFAASARRDEPEWWPIVATTERMRRRLAQRANNAAIAAKNKRGPRQRENAGGQTVRRVMWQNPSCSKGFRAFSRDLMKCP
ncbi:MAG: hypothetical protein ACT4NL_13775, partial [Pseudomarimonas sp.]